MPTPSPSSRTQPSRMAPLRLLVLVLLLAGAPARGALQPLDSFIARDREQPEGIHLEDYYPASLDHVTIAGRVYAIPDWAFPFGLYYNRTLLTEAGLVDAAGQPRPPATWEEWYRDNQLLTRRDEQGRLTRVGSYPSGYVPSLFTLATQLGAQFVSPDGQTCTVDEPPVRDALRRLVMFSDYFGSRQALEAFKASTRVAGLDPLLMAGPILWSLLLSFTRYSVLKPARWVGLDNYASLFTADPLFWKSLANTCFMMLGIPLGMGVGLGLALLLQRTLRGMTLYRTLYYLLTLLQLKVAPRWVYYEGENPG